MRCLVQRPIFKRDLEFKPEMGFFPVPPISLLDKTGGGGMPSLSPQLKNPCLQDCEPIEGSGQSRRVGGAPAGGLSSPADVQPGDRANGLGGGGSGPSFSDQMKLLCLQDWEEIDGFGQSPRNGPIPKNGSSGEIFMGMRSGGGGSGPSFSDQLKLLCLQDWEEIDGFGQSPRVGGPPCTTPSNSHAGRRLFEYCSLSSQADEGGPGKPSSNQNRTTMDRFSESHSLMSLICCLGRSSLTSLDSSPSQPNRYPAEHRGINFWLTTAFASSIAF